MRTPRRTTIALAIAGTLAATGAAVYAADPGALPNWPYDTVGSEPNAVANAAAAPDAVLAVVGDTACEPDDPENTGNPAAVKCGGSSIGGNPATGPTSDALGMAGAFATVRQITTMKPQALALLGDEQYQVGKLTDFEQSFDKTYGALKWIIKPAPGNHEYYNYAKKGDNEAAQNGKGYFAYFNGTNDTGAPNAEGQAGDDTDAHQGWYSYNVGDWHLISLNAECGSTVFGGNSKTATTTSCDPTKGLAKAETDWLAYDLAHDQSRCTVAYWHQPTFTASASGSLEGSELGKAWWELLYQHGHAIVLNGHEHLYARFAPQDPNGNADPKNGIPEFVVGTGGEALDALAPAGGDVNTVTGHHDGANLVTGQDQAFGAMKLTLGAGGKYSWDYAPSLAGAGKAADALSYSDKGSATC